MKMTMVEAKQAVQFAKEKAAEMLGEQSATLEEIERDSYKGRDVWSITLGLPRALRGLAVAPIRSNTSVF